MEQQIATSPHAVPPADASAGRRGSRLSGLTQYAGFVPALLLYGLFFLFPLGLIVAYSFWQTIDYEVVHNWTVDNYRYFFSVPTYVRTMWATLWVSLAATAITLLMAFPLAYWLVRYVRRSLRGFLLVLIVVPFWTSYLLRVYSWLNILGEGGAINRFLQWTGITDHPVSFFLYDRPAVILVLVYLYFPFAALTLYASLEKFDWNQYKAAMDLGASPRTALLRIVLPQMKAGMVTAVIFVFIPILGEYLTPQLVGGARGVMIGNLVVNFFSGAQYTRGAAASLLIAALIVFLLVIFRKSLQVEDPTVRDVEAVSRHASLTRLCFGVWAVLIYLFLFAPIAVLVAFSFNANQYGTFPFTGWTLDWYREVFGDYQIKDALYTSIKVALEVTLISTVVGTAAAFPLVRSNLPFRSGIRIGMTLPIMIPGLLIGVSLLVLLTSVVHLQLSPQTAVIGQSVYTTPFVVLLVAARLQGFDPALERAASDLGANMLNRLRHVVLPLIMPAIVAGALFAFTLSLDEFIITLFLIGGHNTLPIYIYTQVKFGITPEVNALASLLLAASLLLLAIAFTLPIALRRIRFSYRARRA